MRNLKVSFSRDRAKAKTKESKPVSRTERAKQFSEKNKRDFNKKSKSKSKSKGKGKKKGRGNSVRAQKIKRYLKIIIVIAILAGLGGGGYFAYGRWSRLQKFNDTTKAVNPQAKVCDNIFDTKCWTEAFSPKLDQEGNVTGVLIVGLDSREAGGVNQGVMNTDSIMVALYNHKTKKTTLISFPRDLYVPYYINGGGPYYSKINAIYATGEVRDDIDDGMNLLQDAVERILDKKMQYRVVIRLRGVEKAVDAVGGVEIDVPTYLKVQYPNDYPGQNGKPHTQYLYYEFQPGKQKMDGEHALVWARFRMVIGGDMTYASDFSRAERQQEVIDALKVKILADEGSTLDKAEKYWDVFQSLNKFVEADIGLEEVFAGISLADEADLDPVNVVLDPNFGGLNQIIYHPPTSETGGYQIRFKDESFATTRAYLDMIWKFPKLYDEEAKILMVNRMGRAYLDTDKAITFRNSIYNGGMPITSSQLTLITESASQQTGVVIVDMTGGKKYGTTKYLADYFGAVKIIEDPETYGITQSGYKEDIKVIINPAAVQTQISAQ